MKYKVATFHIDCPSGILQTCKNLLSDIAGQAGFEAFDDSSNSEFSLKGYVQETLFDEDALDEGINGFPIDGVKIYYTIEDAEDKDWNETWEQEGFDDIVVDGRIVVFDAKRHSNDEVALHYQVSTPIIIGIDTRQAFGTGTHATTQMILSTLLGMDLNGKRVLDCGTGTGILGIASSKLGAKEVVAYDIDEWSVDNAEHNAIINNVDNMEVLNGDAKVLGHVSGVFDVVMANINRNILLQDMESFKEVMASKATLILSGFYDSDILLLQAKAATLNLTTKDIKSLGDWRCLIMEDS